VSVDAARDAYGVVIDVKSWTVDHPGTVRRREELRTRGYAREITPGARLFSARKRKRPNPSHLYAGKAAPS
jgi:hypothetical protein